MAQRQYQRLAEHYLLRFYPHHHVVARIRIREREHTDAVCPHLKLTGCDLIHCHEFGRLQHTCTLRAACYGFQQKSETLLTLCFATKLDYFEKKHSATAIVCAGATDADAWKSAARWDVRCGSWGRRIGRHRCNSREHCVRCSPGS